MYFDPMYFVFLAPALLLSFWASASVKRNFAKYSRVPAASGLTGAEAAQRLLDREGLSNVAIEQSKFGQLSDHYNPASRSLHHPPSQGVVWKADLSKSRHCSGMSSKVYSLGVAR